MALSGALRFWNGSSR